MQHTFTWKTGCAEDMRFLLVLAVVAMVNPIRLRREKKYNNGMVLYSRLDSCRYAVFGTNNILHYSVKAMQTLCKTKWCIANIFFTHVVRRVQSQTIFSFFGKRIEPGLHNNKKQDAGFINTI